MDDHSMDIKQGDIYWVPVLENNEAEIVHPHVVIQDDVLNDGILETVVVCGLSTNMKRVKEPGTILLNKNEANLPKQSIIIVSQTATVKKTHFGEYIGTLSKERVKHIFDVIRQLQWFFVR